MVSFRREVYLMPEEFKPGCQRPPIKKPTLETTPTAESNTMEAKQAMVKVGKPAPDFTAPAYYDGKFMNIGLSEYQGKWVLLCFYPGDFTFV
jgi:hypothetical protein